MRCIGAETDRYVEGIPLPRKKWIFFAGTAGEFCVFLVLAIRLIPYVSLLVLYIQIYTTWIEMFFFKVKLVLLRVLPFYRTSAQQC